MTHKAILGVIGGSGVYQLEGINIIEELDVTTPYGKPSGPVMLMELMGQQFLFIPRHGKGHTVLPHEVNYCANVYALKMLGADYLISVSAVGSLKEEHAPTSFVLPDQFVDWTKGGRRRSFFGEGIVAHVSVAYPIEKSLQSVIAKGFEGKNLNYHVGGTYLCIEGPQFSTKAESNIYRSFGADVIGMTNVPESYLAKEAGMAYATIAMVTDYDCWKEEHCTVDEIMRVMKTNNENVQSVLKEVIPEICKNPPEFQKENGIGIMTPKDKWDARAREILEVLLR